MNYIEELLEQLKSFSKGDNTKIDVHFIISEPLVSYCFELNQKIRKHNSGFINFGPTSIAIPHLSLFMGFVNSLEMLEKIFLDVSDYAKTISAFYLEPNSIYLKGVSKTAPQYLFIDSMQNDFLMEQKQILDSILHKVVLPIGWDMKNERAHISVDCYKNVGEKTYDLIENCRVIPSCKISQIGISLSGSRGVCLGLLKVFDLGGDL